MKNVYVVMGSTGEYSDHNEWPVKAYLNVKSAEKHVIDVSRRADELIVIHGGYHNVPDGSNEFDPQMRIDYTGVNYSIWPVELADDTL